MKLFAFHFVIEKDSRSFDEWVEDLYEAGGDDATAGMNGEIPFVSFDRESESLVEAIHSARATLRKAGLKPIRVEIEESVLEEALSHVSQRDEGQRVSNTTPACNRFWRASPRAWRTSSRLLCGSSRLAMMYSSSTPTARG